MACTDLNITNKSISKSLWKTQSSTNCLPFYRKTISSLFVNSAGNLPNTMVGSVAGIQGSAALKRASSLRRAWTSGTAAIKRKSLCLQIKFQVVCLRSILIYQSWKLSSASFTEISILQC